MRYCKERKSFFDIRRLEGKDGKKWGCDSAEEVMKSGVVLEDKMRMD